jgi:hypothetical protein
MIPEAEKRAKDIWEWLSDPESPRSIPQFDTLRQMVERACRDYAVRVVEEQAKRSYADGIRFGSGDLRAAHVLRDLAARIRKGEV